MTWQCKDFTFGAGPLIMGVLNVTPDSFSDGGQYNGYDVAVAHARRLARQGAHIIDVGGESTRPGSSAPGIQEETNRVLPVVRSLVKEGMCVSVDTRHAQVAAACLEAGAQIINDVSGFRDPAMRELVAGGDCGVVLMHMLGGPGTMQNDPHYDDVVAEVEEYLLHQAALLEELGVERSRICIDPGPGFGKTFEHNQALIAASARLASHGYPLMVAVSRKSYIGTAAGVEKPLGRDQPSALCAAAACAHGALVARVHDAAATVTALKDSRTVAVALGSNMGDRRALLDAAVDALRKTPGVWVYAVSDYVESEPAYKEDQAPFANAVALLQTTLSPAELLHLLQRIETENGRVRREPNGPRTLDLDILDYEGVVSDDPQLTLPHPRLLERDFTVTPLLQIDPSYTLADGTPVTREHIAYGKLAGRL